MKAVFNPKVSTVRERPSQVVLSCRSLKGTKRGRKVLPHAMRCCSSIKKAPKREIELFRGTANSIISRDNFKIGTRPAGSSLISLGIPLCTFEGE